MYHKLHHFYDKVPHQFSPPLHKFFPCPNTPPALPRMCEFELEEEKSKAQPERKSGFGYWCKSENRVRWIEYLTSRSSSSNISVLFSSSPSSSYTTDMNPPWYYFVVVPRLLLLLGNTILYYYSSSNSYAFVPTRFPKDAALRFSKEEDFNEWKHLLHIYGIFK